MKVLVAAASKHGATSGIAEAIGRALTSAGLDVIVRPPDEVSSLEGYDAVVLGSAVYMGAWLEPARKLVDRQRDALAARPVWLFSSGPVGDPPRPAADTAVDVSEIQEKTGARGHRLFPGRLSKRELGFAERALAAATHSQEGDFRPWSEIDDWAAGIASSLHAEMATSA